MKLPKDIKDEIWQYCKSNNITNVDEFITSMLSRGFTAEKFGSVPWEKPAKIKEVEKVVEKEVIKEVPVEVIKEVEKIVEKKVEVPVEVIKEVVVEKEVPVEVIKEIEKIVEKEVYVTDDEAVKSLQKELDDMVKTHKKNVDNLIKEVENNNNVLSLKEDKIKTLEENIEDKKSEISKLNGSLGTLKIMLNDTSKDDEIKKLNDNLLLFKNESKERGKKINELNKKIKSLENSIAPKTEEEDKGDIYGDNKKGLFGSNISDVWNKKK